MEKDQVLNFLKKYDFKYSVDSENIIVSLDFAQKVIIDFSDGDRVKIHDKLVGWNFLTGLISMSLKNAMIYNFIGGLIIGILFVNLQLQNPEINLSIIYLVFMFWVILFSSYYLVKLESFKTQIMNLNS